MPDKVLAGPPCQLKTIEVDVEKKIFKINGESFGENCVAFSISCDGGEGFLIKMDNFITGWTAGYDMDGEQNSGRIYERELSEEEKLCPYKCGNYCNADVGTPAEVEEKTERYPYSLILNRILERTSNMEWRMKTLSVSLILQSMAIAALAVALILNFAGRC